MGDRAQNPSSSNFNSMNPNDPRLQLQRSAGQGPRPAPVTGAGNVPQHSSFYPVSTMNPLYPFGTNILSPPLHSQPGTTFDTFQFHESRPQAQQFRVAPQPQMIHGQNVNPGFSYQTQQLSVPSNSPPHPNMAPPTAPNISRQHATSSTPQSPTQPPGATLGGPAVAGQVPALGVQLGQPTVTAVPAGADLGCRGAIRLTVDPNPAHAVLQTANTAGACAGSASSPCRLSGSSEQDSPPSPNTAPQQPSPTYNAPSNEPTALTRTYSSHHHDQHGPIPLSNDTGVRRTPSAFAMPDRLPSPPGRKCSLEDPFRDAEEAQAAWGEIAERKDKSIIVQSRLPNSHYTQKAGASKAPVNAEGSAAGAGLDENTSPLANKDTPRSAFHRSLHSETSGPRIDVKTPTPEPSQQSTAPNVGANGGGSRRATPNPIVESNNMIDLPRRSQSVNDGTESGDRTSDKKSERGTWTNLLPDVKVMPSPTRHLVLSQGCKEEIKEEAKEEVKEETKEYLNGLSPAASFTTVTPMKHSRSPSIDDLWGENKPENPSTGVSHPSKRRRLDEISGVPGNESENLFRDETPHFIHTTAPRHSNASPSQAAAEAHDSAKTSTVVLDSPNTAAPTNSRVQISPQGIVVSPHAKIPFTSFSSSRRSLASTPTPENRKRAGSPDTDPECPKPKRARVGSKEPDSSAIDHVGSSSFKSNAPYQDGDDACEATSTHSNVTPVSAERPALLQGDLRGVEENDPHPPQMSASTHDSAAVPQSEECGDSENPTARPSQPSVQSDAQGPPHANTSDAETSLSHREVHGAVPPVSRPAPDPPKNYNHTQSKRVQMDRKHQPTNLDIDSADRQGAASGANAAPRKRNRRPRHPAQFPAGSYRAGANADGGDAYRRAGQDIPGSYSDYRRRPHDEELRRSRRSLSPLPIPRGRTADCGRPKERFRSRSPVNYPPRPPIYDTRRSPRRDLPEHPMRSRSPPARRYSDDLRPYRFGGGLYGPDDRDSYYPAYHDSYRLPSPTATSTRNVTRPPRESPRSPPRETFQHVRDRGLPYPPPYELDSSSHQTWGTPSSPPHNTPFRRATSPDGTMWTIVPRSPDQQGGRQGLGGPASSGSRTESDSSGTNPVVPPSRSAASTALQTSDHGRVPANNDLDGTRQLFEGRGAFDETSTAQLQSANHQQPDMSQLSQPINAMPDPAPGPDLSDKLAQQSRRRAVSSSREDHFSSLSSRPLAARLSSSGSERATHDAIEEVRPSLLSRMAVSSPTEENQPNGRGRMRLPPQSSLRDRIDTEPMSSDTRHTSERVNPLSQYSSAIDSHPSHSYRPNGTPASGGNNLVDRVEAAPRSGRGSSSRGGRGKGRGRGVWDSDSQRR